jgi:hypothetical protein
MPNRTTAYNKFEFWYLEKFELIFLTSAYKIHVWDYISKNYSKKVVPKYNSLNRIIYSFRSLSLIFSIDVYKHYNVSKYVHITDK